MICRIKSYIVGINNLILHQAHLFTPSGTKRKQAEIPTSYGLPQEYQEDSQIIMFFVVVFLKYSKCFQILRCCNRSSEDFKADCSSVYIFEVFAFLYSMTKPVTNNCIAFPAYKNKQSFIFFTFQILPNCPCSREDLIHFS